MAYDDALAERIRDLVGDRPGVSEMTMFGGLAFLVGGNMAVSASGQGGLLVRLDPDDTDRALTEQGAELFEMRGRSMKGWIRVDAAVLDDETLLHWVDTGYGYAATLPPK